MTDGPAGDAPSPSVKPCPICGKPAKADHRPFCSRRCADVDLNRWLNGSYALPAAPDPDDEGGDESLGDEDR